MKAPSDMRREDLEEEVAYLRSELGLQQAETRCGALMKRSCLTPGEARVLAALYGAKGRVVSVTMLEDQLSPTRSKGGEGLGVVAVHVGRIRKKLGGDVVNTFWGRGFAMSEVGLTKVAALLGETL